MTLGSGFDSGPRLTFRGLLRNVPQFVWILAIAIVGASLGILYFHIDNDRETRERHEDSRVRFAERRISQNLHPLDDDLLILAEDSDLRTLWDHDDPARRELVGQELLRWTRRQKSYFKIRILDDRGMEKLRVEINGGRPRIAPVSELESKFERPYFRESMKLKRGEVYISPIDLDVENGRITYPLRPTIRSCTPLFDAGDRKRGVLIFSYEGQRMLDEIGEKLTDSPGLLQLVSYQGYWLKGMNREDEWGFQIPGREKKTFGNAFPDAWGRIAQEESGTFYTSDGLFVFHTINALIAVNPDLSAESLNSLSGAEVYKWKIVSYIPRGTIRAESLADFYRMASVDGALLLVLLPGAFFMTLVRMQRQRTELQLNQQAELIDLAEDSILALNPDMGIKSWNRGAERRYGFTKKEALGRRSYELLRTAFPKPLPEIMADLLKKGHWEGELVDVTREGVPVVNESRWSLQRDDQGRPAAILKISHDIRVKKQLQQELLQAQKLESIGQLAAGIAHEINTPIQFIRDNISFLKDSFSKLETLIHSCEKLAERNVESAAELQALEETADKEYLLDEIPKAIDHGLEGVTRVATLVSAMKEFSHPGTREKTPANVNDAIACTLTVARNEWKYVAEMETDYDPALPEIPCLRGELNQVILNLVVNAAQAVAQATHNGSSGKGKIKVQTRTCPDWIEIRIADSGTGIPEEIRSRIFDPFFTTKEVGKGTGQGLAIARSVVVDKHQGTIHFETEEGKGTTFIIRLPRAGKAVPTAESVMA